MDHIEIVYPPNKPLERVLSPSKRPVYYEHLYFIDANDKDEIILGSCNVTGAYWESSLFFYNNSSAALTNDYSSYYISPSSISDAAFIPNTRKMVLAEDSSHLRLLNVIDGCPNLKCEDFFTSNAQIQQLAVWDHNQKVLSCADTYVTIWDLQNENVGNPIEEYKNIHTNLVTSVTVKKNENNLFATASLDKKACIWDDRMKQPATVLYQNEFCGLTSVAWNPKQSEFVVVGSKAGELYNLDIRQLKEFLNTYHCFDFPIHRIKFNDSGYLAVCGDVTEVIVLNSDDFEVVHKVNQHAAYVRGLTWFNDTLYSCGFDKKIVKNDF